MKPISSNSEYRESDYRFTRQRADRLYVPIDRSPPPIVRWGKNLFGAAVLGVLLAAAWAAPHFLVWVML